MLQSQDLRVGQEKEPYIGFTQENLIENSVQDCLPYILKSHSLYYINICYSQHVLHVLYDVIFPEPPISFSCYHMTCDHYCDCDM